MLALAFLLPVAVGWGLYEIFTPKDDDNGNESLSKTVNGEFTGTEGANNFVGGAGNDTLSGLGGKDTIVGGYGNDVIDGGFGSDHLGGGAGHDIVSGGENNDYIFGGFGDDTLNGDNGDDSIFGEIGEDLIDGGEGSDFIDGGNNDDIIGGFSEADILKGANGNDIMLCNNGDDNLKGQFGNDTLMGGGYYLGLDGDQSAEFMAALQAAKTDPALLAQYNALTVKSDAVFINSDYFANVDLTRAGLDQTDGEDTLYAGDGDDVLHIAMDDVALGGGGEDEFNVHFSQFVSGKPVPLIADFELTEDKIFITYDPAVMSNTTITYTPVENGLLANVGGASVVKLEGNYSEAQVSSRVSIVEKNSTLVTT